MLYERIVVNYMDECNMKCPFCYVPFGYGKTDYHKFGKVVEGCASLGFKAICFSGGDPFKEAGFRDILSSAGKLDFEIHIDTNGMCLNPGDYDLLEETTSLIGFPLDGPDNEVHGRMRNDRRHFDIVLKHLEGLRDRKIKLKVNTVATEKNYEDIVNMPGLLGNYRVDYWCLYQFMPLAGACKMNDFYGISEEKYGMLIDRINQLDFAFEFIHGSSSERYGSHLFVSTNGLVYMHDPSDKNNYKFLGSFFESGWQEIYERYNDNTIREISRKKFNKLN